MESVKSGTLLGTPRPTAIEKVLSSFPAECRNSPTPENIRARRGQSLDPGAGNRSEKPFRATNWLFEIKWDGIGRWQ